MASANDPKALGPAPVSSAIVDSNGNMTFAWSRWFQVLYQRVGGGSTDPLDTVNAKIAALTTRVTNAEAQIATLDTEVAANTGAITALQGDVTLINSQLTIIETLLSSGFSGTIITAQLTPLGSQGSMTFDRGVLVAQTQAT